MIDRYHEILALVGRTFEKGDCLQTARDIFALAGKPFPMPADYRPETIAKWREQWEECDPEPYALVEMASVADEAHVGVLLPDCARVIHAQRTIGSVVIQRLDRLNHRAMWRLKR